MSSRIFCFILISLIGLGAFGAPLFTYALSISPLTFELTANPGDEISNIIKIFNNGESTVLINIVVEDFTASGERGEVALSTDEDNTYSLAKWVDVSPESFVLEPNSFRSVEFTVTVPLDGEPGGHYGSILASTGGVALGGGGAVIAQKIGSLLLLQVAGEIREELSIKSFEAPSFSEYGPVTIGARFENTGTVHLKPRGFILIKNMFGKEVGRIQLPQLNVLPNSIRKIETEFEARRLFGRYSATLAAIYGSTNEPLTFTTSFWVIPWRLMGGIVIVFIVLVFLLYVIRRRLLLAVSILLKGRSALRSSRK